MLPLVALLLAACASEEPGINPERDRFYFPTGLAHDAARGLLYVSNSNADLRYNGATITALDIRALPTDLDRVAAAVAAGEVDCRVDRVDVSRWECPEQQFIISEATIRIGDFPAELALTPDGKRLFTPVRGQDYLLWADVVHLADGGVDLRCDAEADGCGAVGDTADCPVWDCDSAHTVDFSRRLQEGLPGEPFGIQLNPSRAVHVGADGARSTCLDGVSGVGCDCGERPLCTPDDPAARDCCVPGSGVDHVYVAHLAGGEVSFFASTPGEVLLQDFGKFFASGSNANGAFGLAASLPGDAGSPIFVGSHEENALAAFVIRDDQRLVLTQRAGLGAISPGNDVRGLAFSPGGERLYAISRQPPALVAIDMTIENGAPRRETAWIVEVCSEPSLLELTQNPALPTDPQAQLALVVCFAESAVYVIDTRSAEVIGQVATGAGPNALVVDEGNQRAFIAHFLENTVGVIDLDPTSLGYQQLVLRIGLQKNLVADEM